MGLGTKKGIYFQLNLHRRSRWVLLVDIAMVRVQMTKLARYSTMVLTNKLNQKVKGVLRIYIISCRHQCVIFYD